MYGELSKYTGEACLLPMSSMLVKDQNKVLNGGCAYSPKGQLFMNSMRPSEYARIKHIADSQVFTSHYKAAKVIHDECFFAGFYHQHFGHFLIETLPELYRAKLSKKKIVFQRFAGQKNAEHTDFSKEMLCILGINVSDIIFVDEVIRFTSIEITARISRISHSIDSIAREAFLFISSRINSNGEGRNVYLSRSKFEKRGSSEALDDLMTNRGFEVVHPQELSLLKQIELIKSCSVIAGEDGSALHLSVFMPFGGTVIVTNKRPNRNTIMLNDLMFHTTDVR